ncbi:aspartate--tRNA ligase dps1 [Marasmius sp. AFHP31]|nr:aspartate--tRNA ligase dps1 [Marasmius sp. AFHP31]
MSGIKSALSKVKSRLSPSPSSTPKDSRNSSKASLPNGRNSTASSRISKELERLEQKRDTAQRLAEEDARRKEEFERAYENDPPEIRARYGMLPVVKSEEPPHEDKVRFALDQLTASPNDYIEKEIVFRARIHTVRAVSPKLSFFVLRQQVTTIQAVLSQKEGEISDTFVRWGQHLKPESFVLVHGIVRSPSTPIQSTSIHDLEVHVTQFHVIASPTHPVPFTVYSDELSKNPNDSVHNISDRTRMEHRIVDIRSPVTQSIFRVNAAVSSAFRSYLDSQGFIEIHTPKLQGGATESGSSVFPVKYFGRKAFLAQSPQLGKQMCISGDLGRVYEVGPVFRAENSNTHRHMTEFTGLDLEMTLDDHYHEALRMIDATLKHIFKTVYERCRKEIDIIKQAYPHEDLVWKEETVVLPFAEGIKLLKESGWTDDDGEPPSEFEDLGTKDEIQLGKLVKEKYGTDFFILDKFPAGPRPFYTMPDPEDDRRTNSFDIFLRGQEILTGGQRIHDARMLEDRMGKLGVQVAGALKEYVQGFRWGCPPHAGGGIGLERLVMLLLNLPDIRHASLFPRDPKSLPHDHAPPAPRHHDCDTMNPPWQDRSTQIDPPQTMEQANEAMPLEKLIANYGDASNTSWTDDRYKVWRHLKTGAAIGYVPSKGFAIIVGDPLCDPKQFVEVINDFLPWVKKEVGKPIWMLVSAEVEGILGGEYGFKTLTCVAEDRTDTVDNRAREDAAVQKKVRHAKREGVKVIETKQGELPPEDIVKKVDERIKEWTAERKNKGKQMHLTELAPWRDYEHRLYFVGVTYENGGDAKVHALVVLTQLSPQHGWQVKWALDFKDAPSGTIETTVLTALDAAAGTGAHCVTFGAGASSSLAPHHGFNSRNLIVKSLEHLYQVLATEFKLYGKSEFRQKMGAVEDPVYVCFGKGAMGVRGVRALMGFVGDGE